MMMVALNVNYAHGGEGDDGGSGGSGADGVDGGDVDGSVHR